jgi:hypothetical protein
VNAAFTRQRRCQRNQPVTQMSSSLVPQMAVGEEVAEAPGASA